MVICETNKCIEKPTHSECEFSEWGRWNMSHSGPLPCVHALHSRVCQLRLHLQPVSTMTETRRTMKISHISTSCKVKYVLWAATSNWQLSLTQTVPLWILFVSPQRGNLAADTVLDKCRSVNKKQRKNRCTSSSWQMALCASDAIVNCLVLKSLTQLEVSQRVTEYIKHDPTE